MANIEKGWEIIKDMHISGPWQEHIAHKAIMTAMEWKEQEMIDKACKWLKENCRDYSYDDFNCTAYILITDLIEDFKKAMEEGK